jgi:rhomboid protease GluP
MRAMNWSHGIMDGEWLAKGIIILNAIFYLLSLVLSSRRGSSLNPFAMLSPDQTSLMLLGATGAIPIEEYGRLWTLLSANYLHGGIFHILFNMMALRQIAPLVIQEFGPSRMFTIYTLGGVAGYLVSWWVGVPFTIGASAAVCGLIGALLYYGKSRGGVYGGAVYRELTGWVVGLFLFGFIVPGINNWAHGGGIVGGVVAALILGYSERRPECSWHRGLAILLALATVMALGWSAFSSIIFWGKHL